MASDQTTKSLVQEKLRQGENTIIVFECYQIVGNEHQNRLLALVECQRSHAILSFATSKWPPKSFSDLTVDAVFPINGSFQLDTSNGVGISVCQFKLFTENDQSIFYYQTGFQLFKASILRAESEYQSSQTPLDFNWLQPYKREDLTAIDRSIADGTITLKKRESKFREELEKHEHEYIVYKQFRFFIATWNVNGQSPHEIQLQEWLSACDDPPDIYAVAFQELDLSPKAITFNETRPDPVWIRKIHDGLHPQGNYEELVTVRLVGMMLSIFVRQDLRKNIQYSTQIVGTGALNFMGNKGAVGVSMQLNEEHICFVNSHLAAHVHEVERRNEDHDLIIKRMQFEAGIRRRCINEHNHIFWFGDLNYRLIDDPSRDMYNVEDFSELIKYDQLCIERKKLRVFRDYHEGDIKFRPTYKYDPGTDNWDSSEKCRAPAWCDRVLWKGDRIQQLVYSNVMQLQLSDHKPVYSTFNVSIKTKDEQKYKRVHEEVLKRVDKYENDNQPQITVEQTDIEFDIIRFNETSTRDFTVANNCHLPVHFEFRGKDGKGSQICENWIQVEPIQGELFTGDSLSIRIKIFIDTKTAWRLHRKQKKSNTKIPLDILVLHVENGRDIFITIIGEYRPSCFGFSVETLSRLPSAVSELDLADLIKIENSTDSGYSVPIKVDIPREIYLLCDYLHKNGLTTANLFTLERKYRKNPNINDIRDWLDGWEPIEFPGTPHTAAEALLMLLEAYPEPLVSPLEEDCLYYYENFDKACDLIKILSSPKKNVFLYICLFLQDVLKQNATNKIDVWKLATLFGRILLKGHGTSKNYPVLSEKERDDRRTKFMYIFLINGIKEFARSELTISNIAS